jgi:hypothetical protein
MSYESQAEPPPRPQFGLSKPDRVLSSNVCRKALNPMHSLQTSVGSLLVNLERMFNIGLPLISSIAGVLEAELLCRR